MTNVDKKNLEKLMDDKGFVMTMLSQDTPEEVQKLFRDNGVEMSMDEVMELGAELDRYANNSGELDETALENVSGGIVLTAATCWAAAKAVIAVGAAGLAIYKWYKSAH